MSAIRVVDYDPAWPALFEGETRRLSELLADMVEDIHHIGSTAVVGLSAKPKIDIDAVVRSGPVLAHAVERVKSAGEYAFHGEPYGDGMWTFTTGQAPTEPGSISAPPAMPPIASASCSATGCALIRMSRPTMPR
jgi:GrpB-like predicted nucleotidyltransferase (UPF0157 family)